MQANYLGISVLISVVAWSSMSSRCVYVVQQPRCPPSGKACALLLLSRLIQDVLPSRDMNMITKRKISGFLTWRSVKNVQIAQVLRVLRVLGGCAKRPFYFTHIKKIKFFKSWLKCYLQLSYEGGRNSFWTPDDIWGM